MEPLKEFVIKIKSRLFRISKPRIIIGALLALTNICLCLASGASVTVSLLMALAFIFVSFLKPDIPGEDAAKPYIPRVIYTLTVVLSAFITLYLTQTLLTVGLWSVNIWRAFLGFLCCLVPIALIYALTLRLRLSIIVGSVIPMMLATINYFVYNFRGSEFEPIDFLALKTAMSVVEGYDIALSDLFVYSWILYALFIFTLFSLPDPKIRKGRKLHLRAVTSVGLIVCCITAGIGIKYLEVQNWINYGALYNGYILNFCKHIESLFTAKPDGYATEEINTLEINYSEPTESDRSPDIIVIMNESFADLRVLGDNLKTNTDIMPFFDSLSENTIKGYALSSVYGGKTANSEYEFLSGNTVAFLPDGALPYQQYLKTESYSLVSELSSRGYTCIANHPYESGGWARSTVWPLLGFESCYFEDSYQDPELMRTYISDSEMYDKMITDYENAVSASNAPVFMFGVTMQNHGGYYYDGEDFETTVTLEGMQDCPAAEQYLTLIRHSDKALENLITYFSQTDRDVVLLFYGDHLPSLPAYFYEEIHGGPFETLDEQMLRYTVPFVVWANYDIEEQTIPQTSLNFLSNYVYEAADIPLPAYNQFLADANAVIPAVNSLGYYSVDKGVFLPCSEAEGDEAKVLLEYQYLQYNSLFDKNNKSPLFFPTE